MFVSKVWSSRTCPEWEGMWLTCPLDAAGERMGWSIRLGVRVAAEEGQWHTSA